MPDVRLTSGGIPEARLPLACDERPIAGAGWVMRLFTVNYHLKVTLRFQASRDLLIARIAETEFSGTTPCQATVMRRFRDDSRR